MSTIGAAAASHTHADLQASINALNTNMSDQNIINKVFNRNFNGISSYPTQVGIYRIVGAVGNVPFNYGVLFIFGAGYFAHLAIDTDGHVYIGFTADRVVQPPSFKAVA